MRPTARDAGVKRVQGHWGCKGRSKDYKAVKVQGVQGQVRGV